MKGSVRGKTWWRRVIAYILSVFMCIQSAPFTIELQAAVEDPWDGVAETEPQTDEAGVYLITTAAELAWFARQVNEGNGKVNGRLERTIWLNDHDTQHPWTVIGDSQEHPYRGNFDGNGQKINFMYVSLDEQNAERRYGGLFGVIDGGSVSDLYVSGTIRHGYATYGHTGQYDECYTATGGIAGYLKNGQILNCENAVETEMAGETMYRNAGGIAGICSGLILRCTNQGRIVTDVVFAQRHIGGIAGLVYGSGGQIRYCENRGAVQGYFEVGGIAGALKYGGEIQSCCNYAEITGNSILGGIAGNVTQTGTYSSGDVKECVIRNVYNLGKISGNQEKGGTTAGGIVGQMGYEGWKDEATPSLPILENAYATVQYVDEVYSTRGAIIGYFKSGSLGNVYGMTGSNLSPCAVEEEKSTSYTGTVLMKSETELKSQAMIRLLGAAFTKTTKFDYDNAGFPKLAWQKQSAELAKQADQAILELNGWLSEQNRLQYGSSYLLIEQAVEQYTEEVGTVLKEEELTQILTQARNTLASIKPGVDADNELAAAIDEGILALDEYCENISELYPDLTQTQMEQLQALRTDYQEQLETATNPEEVSRLVDEGKKALENKAAQYEEEKRIEELRANARMTLEQYRAQEQYEQPWNQQIETARAEGMAEIEHALDTQEISNALNSAKNAIDAIIAQIPDEDAWDGHSMCEPSRTAEGVYRIATGEELAWFAYQVNNISGQHAIQGELTADINLGGHNWTPIGNDTVFQGNFNGNGYSIRGLKITEADTYAGLFGAVYGETHCILNLSVSGTIKCKEQVSYAGGIVAYLYGKNETNKSSVENCHSTVSITLSKVTQNDSCAGGIAGYARNAWFRNCSGEGSVVIDSVGKGGIRCFTGGILGYASTQVSIRRCYNSGTVSAEFGAGGIVGKVAGDNCEFTSNYNSGAVQAETYAGGLAGVFDDTAGGSLMKGCYTSGTVNSNKNGEYVGAIAGSIRTGTFEAVYALQRTEQATLALVGYTTDHTAPGEFLSSLELQRDSILANLNLAGDYFIHDYLGVQEGYPILFWQLTLDELKAGAVRELQSLVCEADYEEEQWKSIQKLIAEGIERIQSASGMEQVNEIRKEIKSAIDQVESKNDTYRKQLQEAKTAAVEELLHYVDASLYPEEEQRKISTYLDEAKKRIQLATTIEAVEEILVRTKENLDRLCTEDEQQRELDVAAAQQVDAYILGIGEVNGSTYVEALIRLARNAYEMLTEQQKELVTKYQLLLDAEKAYQNIKDRQSTDAILPTVTETITPATTGPGTGTTSLDTVTEADEEDTEDPQPGEEEPEADIGDSMYDAQEWVDTSISSERENAQKEILFLLTVLLAACAGITTAFGGAIWMAGKKRKEKLVHY